MPTPMTWRAIQREYLAQRRLKELDAVRHDLLMPFWARLNLLLRVVGAEEARYGEVKRFYERKGTNVFRAAVGVVEDRMKEAVE